MTSGHAADFLSGGGEMGRRVRAFDWARHPLGPPEDWPQALRTVVRLMLSTGHPTLIFWGPEYYCLYNDAFAQSLGPEKHPAMLGAEGRPMWQDVWPTVGAGLERVLAGQGAIYRENQLVPTIVTASSTRSIGRIATARSTMRARSAGCWYCAPRRRVA